MFLPENRRFHAKKLNTTGIISYKKAILSYRIAILSYRIAFLSYRIVILSHRIAILLYLHIRNLNLHACNYDKIAILSQLQTVQRTVHERTGMALRMQKIIEAAFANGKVESS